MIKDEYYRKVAITLVFAVLVILAYLLLKPLLVPIILGMILAFIFLPLYNFIFRRLKLKDLSAIILCAILLALIIIPLWYLTPIIADQSIKFFLQAQQLDLGEIIQKIFPAISQSETLLKELLPTVNSFVSNATKFFLSSISKFILNIPTLFLQLVVILFTFYFTLRDNEKIISYVRSLIPFSKDVQDKILQSSKGITNSVIYGRIILGILQGLIIGIGYFVFGVQKALLLTVLSCLAGILPIVGTVIVWLPVSIFLFASGNNFIALGIIGFGLLATFFESIVQPVVLARMVKMNSSIMLIGMIGGLFLFGVLGVLLGPLIIAYLLIVLDIYRDKRVKGILTEENSAR